MSMFDVATDIYTINIYRGLGKHETVDLMTLFVILSLALLLLVAAIHHRNKRKMLIEMLGTVTFTKPAFSKFRVLTNAKMESHAIMPPVSEMMAFKMCEVFSESIPMSVIQVVNVLESEVLDWIVVGAGQDFLRVCAAVWFEAGGRKVEHVLAELLPAAGEEPGDGDSGSGWR